MDQVDMAEKRVWIPKISDERLNKLFESIKPVIDCGRRGLRYIADVDLREIAYTWEPKPKKKARGLEAVRDIRTYHTYGYYGYFKPTIAEVLAQIPEELLGEIVAFEIIKHPETAADFDDEREAFKASCHVATTRLYKKV